MCAILSQLDVGCLNHGFGGKQVLTTDRRSLTTIWMVSIEPFVRFAQSGTRQLKFRLLLNRQHQW